MKKLICFVTVLLSVLVNNSMGVTLTLGGIVEGKFYKVGDDVQVPLYHVTITLNPVLDSAIIAQLQEVRSPFLVLRLAYVDRQELYFMLLNRTEQDMERGAWVLQGMMPNPGANYRVDDIAVASWITLIMQSVRFMDATEQPSAPEHTIAQPQNATRVDPYLFIDFPPISRN